MEDQPNLTTPSASKTAFKPFQIKKWNAVALWAWDLPSDNCPICRNNICDPCIECQAAQVPPNGEVCGVACGVCNHSYHLHCISRWIKTRPVCPFCSRDWEFLKYGR